MSARGAILQREADLRQKLNTAQAKARGYCEKAEAEDRLLSSEESGEINKLLAEGKEIKEELARLGADRDIREQIAAMSAQDKERTSASERKHRGFIQSLGAQFTKSEAMDWLQKTKGIRPKAWSAPSVELEDPWLQGATITSDTASGGDLIQPDFRPGIVELQFKRLTIADLLAPGTTDSNLISYLKELVFTNAAAAVAEGAQKPESSITYDAVTDAVKKIAHWIPVTDEMLEDVAQMRSMIDARLRLGLALTEEDQLLNGSGAGANILGLMNRSGLATSVDQGADTNEDAIFKQIWAIFTNALFMADGIVMNPANWQTIALRKDSTGNYMATSPFAGNLQAQRLWGLPVVVTPSIVANTALIGAFKLAAQIFRRGGVRVEVSNSHLDFFTKNLIAILCEERLALAVYRPGAIGKVINLD
jgi:HK97 family phage major capsid protein